MSLAIGALLLAIGCLALLLGLWLWRRSGLPMGRVIYSDTRAWQPNMRTFVSPRYRLVGRPDYLVQTTRGVVPVEVKSTRAPAQPYASHLMQIAAYCLLIEESFGKPPYGIICYTDRQFAVDYTPGLREMLIATLRAMREALHAGCADRSHAETARCQGCGYRDRCDQALTL
ncbi:MAG: CRISPR-associated protein Cas4 [Thermoflexales bacterium]|nr:CRISPR-associated protein Cas4 [Thermoflexales bacterium]MCS7325548.1 CRISPR-associated protein Cas4 [Thermoflexales bacterium]MCX7938285.1 CRISPR-associated protein Cas4 [Thermoflexales bacterium]MDW8053770.1 CRISPR-associated protein Cas4 [Anaerolineae bacterium]MDW8293617.1 CRISPR-associated protein Cas4 [Anaerolineae bacterium]